MSDSYNCETELRKTAEQLHAQAYDLERAADTLQAIREEKDRGEELQKLKQWAKGWFER